MTIDYRIPAGEIRTSARLARRMLQVRSRKAKRDGSVALNLMMRTELSVG
jgi:hypothetical protein